MKRTSGITVLIFSFLFLFGAAPAYSLGDHGLLNWLEAEEFPYEVKVNLDPVTAEAAFPELVSGVSMKPRSVVYYEVEPTPPNDKTIIRARRDNKNKTDITVKLRGIREIVAWLLTNPRASLEGLECEYDAGSTGEVNLSCDIKVETSNDTTPLDGASVKQRLDESQRRLFLIGTRWPLALSKLVACPTIATRVWKEIEPVAGCDEATVEVWSLADGPLYELSCKTTTKEEAQAGLQERMDELGIEASPDQRGKTTRALEECRE